MRAIMGVEPVFLERSFEVMTERNVGIDAYLRDERWVWTARSGQ